MPQFVAGEAKTATVEVSNPTSSGFDYNAVLYLGIQQVAADAVAFHLNAGETKQISFTIAMPAVTGTYPVYLSVSSGGALVGLYQATEDVVITAAVADLVLRVSSTAYSGPTSYTITVQPGGQVFQVGETGEVVRRFAEGEVATLTVSVAAFVNTGWIIFEEGQFAAGHHGEMANSMLDPGSGLWYTVWQSAVNPLTLTMRANTQAGCITTIG